MEKRLTVKQKLGFGIFDLGGNMFFTLMGFWALKYLTDIAGIAAAWAGVAMMAGKVWDAVTDPVMGFISDRTLSRWGRRRPYLLFGAVPRMLTLWLFFTSPGIENPVLLTLWAVLALTLLNTASTVVNIPYAALTPELTEDYHERTSLNGYRFGCAVFGTITGAAAVQPLTELFGAPRRGFSMMGLILGTVIALVTLITFFGTKEKKYTKADLPTRGFFATYKQVFTNKPFVQYSSTAPPDLCSQYDGDHVSPDHSDLLYHIRLPKARNDPRRHADTPPHRHDLHTHFGTGFQADRQETDLPDQLSCSRRHLHDHLLPGPEPGARFLPGAHGLRRYRRRLRLCPAQRYGVGRH
jgi:hypothetical protein